MMIAAMLSQLVALRAQVEALIVMAQTMEPAPPPPIDPAETCPICGATGDSQVNTSTLDGTKRRRCTACGTDRIL